MGNLLDGRKLLIAAFAGLTVLAVTLAMVRPPFRPVTSVAASDTMEAKAAPVPAPSAKPVDVRPVDERFVIKRILPIEGAIRYGEWHWDEVGAPAGPIVVTVDLEARVVSVFRNGYEIGAAAVLLGTQEKPTPTGVFPITQKKRHHVSNLYDSPMPYMQRLTDDGISLHATKVELGYASHGCIGMPEEFARKVFETTEIGDRVFITRGKTAGIGDSLVAS